MQARPEIRGMVALAGFRESRNVLPTIRNMQRKLVAVDRYRSFRRQRLLVRTRKIFAADAIHAEQAGY